MIILSMLRKRRITLSHQHYCNQTTTDDLIAKYKHKLNDNSSNLAVFEDMNTLHLKTCKVGYIAISPMTLNPGNNPEVND